MKNKQWLIGAAKVIGMGAAGGALYGGGQAALEVLANAPPDFSWAGFASAVIVTVLAYVKKPAREIRK